MGTMEIRGTTASPITKGEIEEALNRIKKVKVMGLDEVPTEISRLLAERYHDTRRIG